jgi:hypothetical protein
MEMSGFGRPDGFLADVRELSQKNLAVELLQRLIKNEVMSLANPQDAATHARPERAKPSPLPRLTPRVSAILSAIRDAATIGHCYHT